MGVNAYVCMERHNGAHLLGIAGRGAGICLQALCPRLLFSTLGLLLLSQGRNVGLRTSGASERVQNSSSARMGAVSICCRKWMTPTRKLALHGTVRRMKLRFSLSLRPGDKLVHNIQVTNQMHHVDREVQGHRKIAAKEES